MAISKKLAALTMSGLTAVSMMGAMPVFAANNNPTEAAAKTAERITVGKTITSKGDTFPNQDSYKFKLTSVEGYSSSSAAGDAKGDKLSVGDLPMPEGATANQDGSKSAEIDVDGFNTKEDGDTDEKRVRSSAFSDIDFSSAKAGSYVYQLQEVAPETKAKGVTYDSNNYYVVVYVVNDTDENGKTLKTTHVEATTVWRDESGKKDKYPENLDDLTKQDNQGKASVEVGEDVFDKVQAGTNSVDATKFWNHTETQDLTIENKVSGNLGNTEYKFPFTVTLNGDKNTTYKFDGTQPVKTAESATTGTLAEDKTAITTDENGKAVFNIELSADEAFKVLNLPTDTTYTVEETAKQDNHTADFKVAAGNAEATIATASKTSDGQNTALSTSEEALSTKEDGNTVTYTNTKGLQAPTGAMEVAAPFAVAAAVAAGVYASRKRKEDEGVHEA